MNEIFYHNNTMYRGNLSKALQAYKKAKFERFKAYISTIHTLESYSFNDYLKENLDLYIRGGDGVNSETSEHKP